MTVRISQDHSRFKQIVRGRIKDSLRKYISKGELISQQGKKKVSISLPSIDLPRFRFGDRQGGVSMGDGDVGDSVGEGEGEGGKQGAGQNPGEHALEVDFSIEELADMLGEALELPNIEPKGSDQISTQSVKYTGIQRSGPESLRHFKRTFKQALRRQIAMGSYDPKRPTIVPTREDKRYRSWRVHTEPQTNAAIIYMMDVSGSMGDEQKEIVRIESFWIDAWLRRQYQGIETRYIIHDAMAREVDRDTFFRTRESGGTMISSAYKLACDIIDADYPSYDWNIYPFHFSDGDNWSSDDTRQCLDILRDKIIPASNAFFYGQVESPYGSGQFIKDLRAGLGENERVVTSEIPNKDSIYDSIRDFLGRGF